MKFFLKSVPFIFFTLLAVVFFYPFIFLGKLPIPADTVVGLYHPFRDLYLEDYPNGIPYKNFLLTDPVRQQYPWKELAVNSLKNGVLPIWNPYEMSGKPQLANFQTGVFYPLNLLLFIQPFYFSWSLFIFVQPILAGIFMYLYLRNLQINKFAATLGSICFAFSGFMIAWLEWGIIGHTYLWLPLILLSIDKGFLRQNIFWKLIYVASLSISFFAGHLQIFSYLFAVSITYFFLKILQQKKKLKIFFSFLFDTFLVSVILLVQLIPTINFINLSNRAVDQSYNQLGWFIPLQNLSMFLAPDFFGNPATLNYYGVWNYAEFSAYIGVIGLLFVLYAVLLRRDKKTFFWTGVFLGTLILATDNFIARIPYMINIPFVSTAQPTRLIGITAFSLSILAALGFDYFIKHRKKIWVPILLTGVVLVILLFITQQKNILGIENSLVAFNNLKLPFILYLASAITLLTLWKLKDKTFSKVLFVLIIILLIFDLFRFGWKFTPFTSREYLFPETKIVKFLQTNTNDSRIATLDDRILPPNFQTIYKLKSINGYDPLYLKNYAQLIVANERENHSVNQPFGFNRILVPKNINSQIFSLLGVKYVLTLQDIENNSYEKVYEEGQTKVYENKTVFPYAYFVERTSSSNNTDEQSQKIFSVDLRREAVGVNIKTENYSVGIVKILTRNNNETVLEVENNGLGFLVISDIYYPSILATIDGIKTKVYEVNMALRAIEVPSGKHTIIIKNTLF